MRASQWIAIALLGAACAGPAQAGDPPDPLARIEPLLDPRLLIQGVVREEDVSLLFAHLRAALIAAQEGREAPPPEALNQRAEAIAAKLKARGTLAGLLLLNAFEAAARQAMREALTEPAPSAP